MKFTNKAAFSAGMKVSVVAAVARDIVPMFKGVVMEAARALVSGDYRYAGTPEWTGNAAANWWPSSDAPASNFETFFSDPGEPGFKERSPYNGNANQRAGAVDISLVRIDGFLRELPGIPSKVFLTNTAPYLQEYQPYGDGRVFRLENLYPLSAYRAALFLNPRIAMADTAQFAAWREGYAA